LAFVAIFAIPREPLKLRQHVRDCKQGFENKHTLLCQRRVCDVGQGKKGVFFIERRSQRRICERKNVG